MKSSTFLIPKIALGQMLPWTISNRIMASFHPLCLYTVFYCNELMITLYYDGCLQAMSIMGLYESAYWLSWLTWEAFLALLSSLFSVLFGMMFRFDFFLHNSFVVLFLVFFLFQFNMVSVCVVHVVLTKLFLVCVNVGC